MNLNYRYVVLALLLALPACTAALPQDVAIQAQDLATSAAPTPAVSASAFPTATPMPSVAPTPRPTPVPTSTPVPLPPQPSPDSCADAVEFAINQARGLALRQYPASSDTYTSELNAIGAETLILSYSNTAYQNCATNNKTAYLTWREQVKQLVGQYPADSTAAIVDQADVANIDVCPLARARYVKELDDFMRMGYISDQSITNALPVGGHESQADYSNAHASNERAIAAIKARYTSAIIGKDCGI